MNYFPLVRLISLFLASCVFVTVSHAEIISQNLVVGHNDIQVLDSYSSKTQTGLIRVQSCSTCDAQDLILDSESILLFKGQQLGMDILLYTRLRSPSKQVRIQYNQRDKTVSYIRWTANSEQEKGLL